MILVSDLRTLHGRPDLIAKFEYLQAEHHRGQLDCLTIMRPLSINDQDRILPRPVEMRLRIILLS